jgi:hypothetical protein
MTPPLIEHLQRQIAEAERARALHPEWPMRGPPCPIERAVVDHGREYVGIERPKGYRRQWTRKECFRNAYGLAVVRNRGTYVEGFVRGKVGADPLIIHHAWITIDGVHSIDPTLPDAPEYLYYGIPFSNEIAARAMLARGYYYGVLDLLVEKPDQAALLKLGTHDATTQ